MAPLFHSVDDQALQRAEKYAAAIKLLEDAERKELEAED